MKRFCLAVVFAFLALGCKFEIPQCVKDGSCLPADSPKPSPSPEESPSPFPSPTPKPSPSPEESPFPFPSPSPSPCEEASPFPSDCVRPEGCVSCAQWVSGQLAGGHLTRLPNGLLYNDPGGDSSRREYVDPNTCFMVFSDGSLRNKRYHRSGEVCPDCTPAPQPTPCPAASPSPGAPNPQATPATCPPLARVGGGLYACQRNGVQKSCGDLVAGDKAELDSTHHFGRRQVASCDEPWDTACGGRMCDDIVGGTKFIVERGDNCRKSSTHQLTCAPLVSGGYRIRLCANDDYRDQLGQPVNTSQTECTVVEFEVR